MTDTKQPASWWNKSWPDGLPPHAASLLAFGEKLVPREPTMAELVSQLKAMTDDINLVVKKAEALGLDVKFNGVSLHVVPGNRSTTILKVFISMPL